MPEVKLELKVLMLDAATGFYRMQRYRVGDFFGPVDMGIHLAFKHNALTIGGGLLAGSIFPGSSRLIFTGISPCWHGFFVSSMGGAALAFNYRTIHWSRKARRDLHQRFILDHYLKQFDEETIATKQQHTCGEPCAAVCKKLNGAIKKDYEPYHSMFKFFLRAHGRSGFQPLLPRLVADFG